MLGIPGNPFTISLWVKPMNALAQSAIVFVHEPLGWFASLITTRSNGPLMLNHWRGYSISISGPILLLDT
jgi:hypothetical protein